MKINKRIKSKISYFLQHHRNFFISAHTSPEGDSLGAQLAFARLLESLGKKYDIINSDLCPREYSFLPAIAKITREPKIKKYDATIILDCSCLSRIGNAVNYLDKSIPILNIDHHVSNERFGYINLVETNISSTCEILYWLFKELNFKIDKFIALNLYVGIMTDTGCFRYTNTNWETHRAVSELLKHKIDVARIFRHIHQNLEINDLKLISRVLTDIKEDETGKLVWVKIKESLIKHYRPQIDLADIILNFLRTIRKAEVFILFRERVGENKNIRVNLRSTGAIDVNRIAQHFGGGGHKTASGITLRNMSIRKSEKLLIDFIKKSVKFLKK